MIFLPKVLFICTYRGGRSQIAEAYAKKHAADVFDCESACFDPGRISSGFVSKIATLGLDIQEESPVSVFTLYNDHAEYEYVVCLCTDIGTEMCRLFRTNIDTIFPTAMERIHWDVKDFKECFEDPRGFEVCLNENCKAIEEKVLELKEYIASAMTG